MIPLCTTASWPPQSVCGWAFGSFGGPCVAHLVWPRPTVPGSGGWLSSAATRLPSLPARFSVTSMPSASTAIPAES